MTGGNGKIKDELGGKIHACGMLVYDQSNNDGRYVYLKNLERWTLQRMRGGNAMPGVGADPLSPAAPSPAPEPPSPAPAPPSPAPAPEPPGPAPAPNAADDTDMMLIGSVSLSSFCCVCLILIVFVMMQKDKV
jgi:hypothetical protein